MSRQVIMVACTVAMAACAPSYDYRPATNATATMKGHVAADYQVPPTAPQGEVRLASFGMSEISPNSAPQQKQVAAHVRMMVIDNSQTPWTLDTRQQQIALSGGPTLSPAYVSTHEGQAGLPQVTVPAGGKRIIDLFYPLPPNMQSASQVPEFDVVWHVNTPQQVTERTSFDRLRIEPQVATGYGPEWGVWDEGWDGPFWYDGTYPGYYGGGIVVGAPRWGGWGEARGGEHFGGHEGGGHGGGHR